MKLYSTFLILLYFSVYGTCQEFNQDSRNSIFGQFKFNSLTPAISLSYERIFYRKSQIDFGGFLSLNITNYREYFRSELVKPSLSIGVMFSKKLTQKHRILTQVGADFFPFHLTGIYFQGKLAYEYYWQKARTGFRFFILGNVDIDYNLFIDYPNLTFKQIPKPTKFYWSPGLAIGKYF